MGGNSNTAPASRGRSAQRVGVAGLVGVLCLAAAPVVAQRIEVATYAETDGLPSSNVLTLTQDALGRMWFATRAGIAAYDGVTWDERGVIRQPQRSLLWWDNAARLWAASRSGPFLLRVFEDGTWSNIPSPAPPRNRHGITALGAMTIDGKPRVVVGTEDRDLLLWDGAAWHDLASGLPGPVEAVAVGPQRVLAFAGGQWFGSIGGGPAQPVDGALLPGGGGLRLTIDKATGIPWLIGRDRILRFDDDGAVLFATGLDLPPAEQLAGTVALDPLGALWVGHLDRVYRIHPREGAASFTMRNGLIANGAVDLLCDREGLVWIASPRGVSKVVSLRFAGYRADNGLYEDEVTAVTEQPDGTIVLGHIGALSFLDGDGIRIRVLADRNRRARVLDLEVDANGHTWAALEAVGVAEIGRDGSLRWHLTDVISTRSAREGPDGAIWVAAQRQIYRGGSSGFAPVSLPGAPVGIDARRILRVGDALYFASVAGLFRLENGAGTYFANPDDAAATNVFAVLDDGDRPPLVGTAGGLMRAVGGTLTPAGPDPPATERPVYFLIRDHEGRLWIGTDNGVLRWDGVRLTHFSAENGLMGRETNRAAGIVDSRGRVWIGTDRGVSIYRAELDYETPARPIVTLLRAEFGGQSRPLDAPLRLPHATESLTFGFRAVSFIDERRVRVQTRLEGFEDDWLEHVGPGRASVRYTNLQPGDYRLHLRAANADGNWSDTVTSSRIVVLRPFWYRPWFLLALGAAVVGLGWTTHRWMARRRHVRLEESRRLEGELARTQRLESLGVLAGGIAHDFNNLLTIVLGNLSLLLADRDVAERHARNLGSAESAVRRARELTQQLMTFARGGTPARRPAALDDVVRDAASLALSGANACAALDVPGDLWAARIDIGQINQVLHNLLLNAVQAMPEGGTVRIVCRNRSYAPAPLGEGHWVEIAVADEGTGIAPEHMGRVFDPYFSTKEGGTGLGLAVAYSIVRRHGGLLTVESPPGSGATFRVWLPATGTPAEPRGTLHPTAPAGSSLAAHVLVMDDEPAVREIVGELLKSLGCTVECAQDGEQALELYVARKSSPRPFDLVLMDLTVPGGMGGKEAMARLIAFDPDACGVVASGYSNDPVMAHHADYGFRACVRKPFGADELADMLKRVLSRATIGN